MTAENSSGKMKDNRYRALGFDYKQKKKKKVEHQNSKTKKG